MQILAPRRPGRAASLAFLASFLSNVATAATTVTLPIEVVGENGTTSSAVVDVPAGRAREVRSLWMQIHGLSYDGMASVQVNGGDWLALDNGTVVVAEPGKSYGGIGGGFSTLKLTLALPANAVHDGANTIRFRFNRTNGVASGFRVVAFNLLTGDSGTLLRPDAFREEDPSAWSPPLTDSASIRAGLLLWQNAQLLASALPNAPKIRAHCSDCHAHDGRDLKYFGYSNASIAARSRFHGLSDLQGRQIASYIRSLAVPSHGRPWNPPYQPGPGLDAQPVANWAGGAGLSWVLDHDNATMPFIFGASSELAGRFARDAASNNPDWNTIVPLIRRSDLRPDGNLNPREIPISMQLPDWNHWLPRVHPLDAWGSTFQNSEFSESYASMQRAFASGLAPLITSGRIVATFDKWTTARRALLRPYVDREPVNWSPDLGLKAYSTELWQLVKTWEMTQEFGLEGRGQELFGAGSDARIWLNTIPAATAPAAVGIPDGPSGMGGLALTNEYFDAAWYQLQVVLNSGNHRHRNRVPIDWFYVVGGFRDLLDESRRPEPARLLVVLIKAMQSTDPSKGPDDVAQGWRPGQNVDPTLMVHAAWAAMFQPLPGEVKRAFTESLLTAWLNKNRQYRLDQYFRVGLSESSYAPPAKYADIAGKLAWEAAPSLLAAGVDPNLVRQLQAWGASYTEMASRFQYAPGGTARSKAAGSRGRDEK
jgi:hypothetical protein